ncbi:metal-dependent hydrolase [Halorussus sp. MSC15.2]|uniref:metal-dependent hydrolase n=1 Tax=Halorussus sp. MSC15.2 TaxID=2283638 RepID=UPI0013D58E15|nr:metal-dependent hydrolase [Halorussus sp. MSC15.2]NEU56865.1 metal-dependent hydrolase [Halorussus sp. MSC15.2]
MYPLGHVGMALLFVAPVALALDRRRRYPPVAALALATALLPDVDGKIPFSHHHGGPHTVLFALVGSLAVGLALAFVSANVSWAARRIESVPAFRPRAAFALGFAGALAGLASHLFADLLMIPIADNPVEPLWPFSQQTVALGVMHPGDPAWNWGLLAAGIAVQVLLFLAFVPRVHDRVLAVREGRSHDSNRPR